MHSKMEQSTMELLKLQTKEPSPWKRQDEQNKIKESYMRTSAKTAEWHLAFANT